MTRKRFWGLRNALVVELNKWAKANGFDRPGTSDKSMRPVSGVPLVKFGEGPEPWTSYDECWNGKAIKGLRKTLGMEVAE